MLLPVFVQRADNFTRVTGGNAVGGNATVDDASGANDAVVADGDIWKDDAVAADETVVSNTDGPVDDRFGVAVREVADDACGGIVGDECHVETYGGVVADGDEVGFGGEDDRRDGFDDADVVADFNTEGAIVGNGVAGCWGDSMERFSDFAQEAFHYSHVSPVFLLAVRESSIVCRKWISLLKIGMALSLPRRIFFVLLCFNCLIVSGMPGALLMSPSSSR